MAHPKSAYTAVLSPVVLSKKVEDYEPVAEFLSSCKSSYTAKGCKTALNKFFNFVAVEKKGFDPVVAIKMKPEQLNPIVLKYAMHLKKVAKNTEEYRRGEVNVNSVLFYINAVKQFFDYHEVLLSWKKIKRFIPERMARKYHVCNRAEIEKLLAVSNPRERAIILILVSAGIRAQALLQFQLRDLEVIENNIGHLIVYARTSAYYHTQPFQRSYLFAQAFLVLYPFFSPFCKQN